MVQSFISPLRNVYQEFNLVPLLNRTANGQSNAFRLEPEVRELRLFLSITAFGGTNPELTVTMEEAWDLSETITNWLPLGAWNPKTAQTNEALQIVTTFTRIIRANWSLTGTGGPNFTFKIDGVGRS